MSKKRVLVAMSGGVDSSVAAILLKEQGYELVGVTFRTWDYIAEERFEKETAYCSIDSIMEAKNFADKLGFPHHVLDIRDTFKKNIIDNFISEYLSGRTPNPCVVCNSYIKWGKIVEKADELNCDYIATGHYAQIKKENDRYVLYKGKDELKDQTYFLWNLTQDNLKRTLFPLGGYEKPEIKELANEAGFKKLASKRESQEICFIPDNDYRKFLKENVKGLEEKVANGNFISTNGKILGKHKGYPFYTIGQRKGLEIALGQPMYVTNIDADKNEITLGTRDELEEKQLTLSSFNLIKYKNIDKNIKVKTKIRYNTKAVESTLKMDNNKLKITFHENVWGVTPGQSAVFYDENDAVVGGGIIEK